MWCAWYCGCGVHVAAGRMWLWGACARGVGVSVRCISPRGAGACGAHLHPPTPPAFPPLALVEHPPYPRPHPTPQCPSPPRPTRRCPPPSPRPLLPLQTLPHPLVSLPAPPLVCTRPLYGVSRRFRGVEFPCFSLKIKKNLFWDDLTPIIFCPLSGGRAKLSIPLFKTRIGLL